MKRLFLLSVVTLLLAAGSSLAQDVRYNFDKSTDFSKFKTYKWVEAKGADPMEVGGQLEVQAKVNLGGLSPDDVQVQLFHGVVDNQGDIPEPATIAMSHNGSPQGASWIFKGTIPCRSSGQHGYAVRVLPHHADLANPFEPGLVCWG